MIKMDRKGIKSNHTEDQKNQEVDGHNIILKLGVNEPCEDNHVQDTQANLQSSTSGVKMPIVAHSSNQIAIASPLSAITEDEYFSIQSEEENLGLDNPITKEVFGQQQGGEQQNSNLVTTMMPINCGNQPKTRQSVSSRCGLVFPVSRVHRKLRVAMLKKRVGPAPAIYLAAVLEYLVAELIELSGDFSKHDKKARISPRHIKLAVLNDAEISGLLSSVIIASGGVLPDNINSFLLPPKKNLLKSTLKGTVLSPAF